jgi:hypothetical protein
MNMRDPIIRFIEPERLTSIVSLSNTYTFRKDKPLLWLQRFCLWILGKIGAEYQYGHTTIKYHEVDTRRFVEKITRQIDTVKFEYHVQPTRILIGTQDFHELMGGGEIHELCTFNTSYSDGQRHAFGLNVQIIPWMRGILVI